MDRQLPLHKGAYVVFYQVFKSEQTCELCNDEPSLPCGVPQVPPVYGEVVQPKVEPEGLFTGMSADCKFLICE